ncbi:MAG: aldehyde ferredoxin oxidoreductase [bacterium]|nr:aldehyde ferredoxin oxidoreductase [bacterium]
MQKTTAGYTGKILWVDLTEGQCVEERIPGDIYYNYLSGTGLASRILYERIPENADPLGPDNILAFVSGLLTGTGSLFTGRWMAAAKSPLTGTWGDSNCGGNFSPAIKQCGYDGIFFSGISPKPVYLHVSGKGAEILPAEDLWGKDTTTTEEILISRGRGKKTPAVACIGPAGEKLSLISGICNDRGRIAARSGLGAVMGSKRLKALVLEGARPVYAADRGRMKQLSIESSRKIKGFPLPGGKALVLLGCMMGKAKVLPPMNGKLIASAWEKWGTCNMNQFSVEWGDSPIKNWKGSLKDYPTSLSRHINPDLVIARETQKYHCFSCPMGCGGICTLNHGKWKETHKPEYETTMAFSGLLLSTDLERVFYINELLNRAGMDTISAGGTVAFAQECFERGFITKEDTGGIDLSWGNAEGIVALVEKMVKREGIGDLLADGSKVAAEKIGKDSSVFAVTAGGQEIAMHDPRCDPGYGLHAAVEPAPGRHSTGSQQYYELYGLWKKIKNLPKPKPLISVKSRFKADRKKAVCAVANSCYTRMYNGAGLCMFGALLGAHRLPVFEWLNAAAGWDREPEEYMEVGRRVQTLMQLFNLKHGIEPVSLKTNPRSVGEPPLTEGPNRGRRLDLDRMMADYWREIGWDETGRPTAETIEALGLKRVVGGEEMEAPVEVPGKRTPAGKRPAKGSKPVINKKVCVSCSSCIRVCPVSCLVFEREEGRGAHPYPGLPDAGKCISCGFCKEECPVEAISMNL